MEVKEESWHKKQISCPLCLGNKNRILGIRGNREYFDADPFAEPHIFTNVVQCKNCGFIYTNPMIVGMEYLEKLHYNDPGKYQGDKDGMIPGMFKKRLKYISKYKSGKILLDVGAGKGEFLNEAAKLGWLVQGVEPSLEFCKFAKEKFSLNIVNGYLGLDDKIEKNQFDLITLNHVLEHVDQPYELLKLISKYLNKDGVIFIEVPNSGSLLLSIADLYFRIKGLNWSSRLSPLHPPFHKYGYTRKSLKYILNKSGYEIADIQTFSGNERSDKHQYRNFSIRLRNLASGFINLLGNRELLCVVAKPSL